MNNNYHTTDRLVERNRSPTRIVDGAWSHLQGICATALEKAPCANNDDILGDEDLVADSAERCVRVMDLVECAELEERINVGGLLRTRQSRDWMRACKKPRVRMDVSEAPTLYRANESVSRELLEIVQYYIAQSAPVFQIPTGAAFALFGATIVARHARCEGEDEIIDPAELSNGLLPVRSSDAGLGTTPCAEAALRRRHLLVCLTDTSHLCGGICIRRPASLLGAEEASTAPRGDCTVYPQRGEAMWLHRPYNILDNTCGTEDARFLVFTLFWAPTVELVTAALQAARHAEYSCAVFQLERDAASGALGSSARRRSSAEAQPRRPALRGTQAHAVRVKGIPGTAPTTGWH